jgi:hypothetical protein
MTDLRTLFSRVSTVCRGSVDPGLQVQRAVFSKPLLFYFWCWGCSNQQAICASRSLSIYGITFGTQSPPCSGPHICARKIYVCSGGMVQ